MSCARVADPDPPPAPAAPDSRLVRSKAACTHAPHAHAWVRDRRAQSCDPAATPMLPHLLLGDAPLHAKPYFQRLPVSHLYRVQRVLRGHRRRRPCAGDDFTCLCGRARCHGVRGRGYSNHRTDIIECMRVAATQRLAYGFRCSPTGCGCAATMCAGTQSSAPARTSCGGRTTPNLQPKRTRGWSHTQ